VKVIATDIPEVLILEPKVFGDERGFFVETFRESSLVKVGLKDPFVQDNHSRSRRGVLRGLHYQLEFPQGKLIRVSRGKVFDVAVDVRKKSPTFGNWVSAILDDKKHRQIYVPPGFAHGFVVLSEIADLNYKCTNYYHPQSENGICWNDPDIGIDWPVEILDDILLSEKDSQLSCLHDQLLAHLPAYITNRN